MLATDLESLEQAAADIVSRLADRDVAEVAAEAQSDFVRGAALAEKVARDRKMRTRRSAA